ncbi:MAG: hypothetical protein KME10_10075 [Plectolyngbya sp. WJT66-NPBG17]|jgi:hypothetical protein|nr:hypothetical protein [Plectolyngbya sp. WJT66-NPBG17]MBW4525590.1 hypothetical protein [Phormidium tanganyikae FI6-MK23]
MNRSTIITACLLLASCTAQAQNPTPTPSPSLVSTPAASPVPNTRAKRFILELSLSAPEDLKVREGDVVVMGQVLSDRTRERQRLEAQKAQVLIQLDRLKQVPIKPLPPKSASDIANLPTPSFLEEEAEIDRKQVTLQQIEQNWNRQQRKIDLLQGFNPNDLSPSTLPHEQEKLRQRERDVKQAKAELELSQAKLDRAGENYQYRQYEHPLEVSKRSIDIERQQQEYQRQLQEYEQQERDRTFQLAQVNVQLQNLETQLTNLSIVKSAYNAKVQRVKWKGQNNQILTVELTLIVGDLRNVPRSSQTRSDDSDDPKPETPPFQSSDSQR